MKVVYIAGPYRSNSISGVVQNIRNAEALAIEVWNSGAVALCPHKNTALFDGIAPDEIWLQGDMELLRRCDAIILVEGWESSSGTIAEVEYARELGIPLFYSIIDLQEWLRLQKLRSFEITKPIGIYTNGTPIGTIVIDLETGKTITNLNDISLTAHHSGSKAILTGSVRERESKDNPFSYEDISGQDTYKGDRRALALLSLLDAGGVKTDIVATPLVGIQ